MTLFKMDLERFEPIPSTIKQIIEDYPHLFWSALFVSGALLENAVPGSIVPGLVFWYAVIKTGLGMVKKRSRASD